MQRDVQVVVVGVFIQKKKKCSNRQPHQGNKKDGKKGESQVERNVDKPRLA